MSFGDDIIVALSTTKHIVSFEGKDPYFGELVKTHELPICSVDYYFPMDIKNNMGAKESLFAYLSSGLRCLIVHTPSRYLFIGQDALKPDTGLVQYTQHDITEASASFFQKWEETQMLLFEFNVLNNRMPDVISDKRHRDYILTIRSSYMNKAWGKAQIADKPIVYIQQG